MSRDYITHWVLGFLATIVWFWGDKIGIPGGAIQLASTIVPGLVGHALSYNPDPNASAPQAGATSTQQ